MNGKSIHNMLVVQNVLEGLPVLPKDVIPANLLAQLERPREQRQGFLHSNGEWNFLYVFNRRQYRLPENLAVVLAENFPQRWKR